MGERLLCTEEVRGSNPLISTTALGPDLTANWICASMDDAVNDAVR